MSVYNIDGYNVSKEQIYLGKTVLASMTCQSNMADGHLIWGEEVNGGTKTPFLNMQSVYNGSTAQCDYRILSYEDGSPIIERGKVYFSMTTRMEHGSTGEIVCEYDLNTCRMKMTGCIIGRYNNAYFNATGNSIMYNRTTHEWILCTHSGDAQGHILLIGKSISDPRFGVTKIDFDVLDYENPLAGDEDQFIFYSSELEKWVMIYVAIRNNGANYILRMHTSDYCDKEFTFYGEVNDPNVLRATGVTSVKIGGVRYVISGSAATGTNKNLVYSFPDLNYVGEISLDYDTGAQLGVWPVLFSVIDGNVSKYYMLTFDRANTITDNHWSYGCMYMYCAIETNEGMEYSIERDGTTVYVPITATYSILQLHFKRQWAYRVPMDYNLPLSEINLDGAVLFSSSNLYPKVGLTELSDDSDGLHLSASGSAIIVGGKHQVFSAYILDRNNIQSTDKRALVIFDDQNNIKAKISVTKGGNVYGYNGNTESFLGIMRDKSEKLIICTGYNVVNIYEK